MIYYYINTMDYLFAEVQVAIIEIEVPKIKIKTKQIKILIIIINSIIDVTSNNQTMISVITEKTQIRTDSKFLSRVIIDVEKIVLEKEAMNVGKRENLTTTVEIQALTEVDETHAMRQKIGGKKYE